MSSYRRPCRECGQRISLRQMPAGQWVAFDVSTEEPHICGIENELKMNWNWIEKELKLN